MDRPWVVTFGDLLVNVTNAQSLNVCPGRLLADLIQRHMVTPASHSFGVGRLIKLEGGKSLVDIQSHLRGAPIDIWGGGGGAGEDARKKQLKKSLLKMWPEKKVCCQNWWKICWPEKPPNGNIHNRKGIRHKYIFQFFNENLKKNCRAFITKKHCFLAKVKKKQWWWWAVGDWWASCQCPDSRNSVGCRRSTSEAFSRPLGDCSVGRYQPTDYSRCHQWIISGQPDNIWWPTADPPADVYGSGWDDAKLLAARRGRTVRDDCSQWVASQCLCPNTWGPKFLMLMDRAYSRGVLPSIDDYFSVKTRPDSVTMGVATETRNSGSMQTA